MPGALTVPHALKTRGPAQRYHYALFIEKEGFYPLLERAQIAERYDLALMSTKGQTVTASRHLVETLSHQGVTILVLHDFDKAGIEILDKFQSDTRRYADDTPPNVIDLGLRLVDAQAMGLQSELVSYPSEVDPQTSLRRCGATDEECTFLVHGLVDRYWPKSGWQGERIELNAMTSRQFLTWLEAKLSEVGVQKVVPAPPVLARAYQQLTRLAILQRALDTALATLPASETIPVPARLVETIRAAITNTADPWDEALWKIVCATQDQERRP